MSSTGSLYSSFLSEEPIVSDLRFERRSRPWVRSIGVLKHRLELFFNGDAAPLGVNFEKQFVVSLSPFYLSSWLFACETNFLGFELDLLTYKFLA